MLYNETHTRVGRARRADLWPFPAGRSVGAVTGETTVGDVMFRLQFEYVEAADRLSALLP